MPASYLDSPVLLNRGDVDARGAANYPAKSQNTPDDLVFQLQADLKTLGFLLGAVDGDFGEGTERAVKQFQRQNGLDDDGKIGKDGKAALRKALKKGAGPDARLAYDALHSDVTSLGLGWDEQEGWLNLVGVRGFWHGEAVTNTFNVYNDTVLVAWKKKGGARAVEQFESSCDPGRSANPSPNGVAHLMEGQYLFSRGLHKGQYRALRQASAVKVKRYFDDDPARLSPTLDEGFFGINIHCGGVSDTVNAWSAGCQIIKGGQKGEAWKRFDQLIYEVAPAEQIRFKYSLLRAESLVSQ